VKTIVGFVVAGSVKPFAYTVLEGVPRSAHKICVALVTKL
jgi:hypothetical protein